MRRLRAAAMVMVVAVISACLALGTGAPASAASGSAVGVLGQAGSFTTGGYSASTTGLRNPNGSAIDTAHHRLFVADTDNNRVVVHNLNTTTNAIIDEVADNVLGQTTFTANGAGLTATGLSHPRALAYDATKDRLYVADMGNQRVMVYNTATIANGMAAFAVLGQPDFTTMTAAPSRSQKLLIGAWGVALDGTGQRLFVADRNNHRVMVWDVSGAVTSYMDATYVIGQSSFTGNDYASAQNRFVSPQAVTVDPSTNRLYIAESGINRVGVYDLSVIATNMNALYVLGQSNFTDAGSGNGPTKMNNPQGVAVGGGRVYVSEAGNMRVMIFDAMNNTNGQPAIGLWGQVDYTTSASNSPSRGADTFFGPDGLMFDPSTFRVWVADSGNNRFVSYNGVSSDVTLSATVNPILTFTLAGRATACNGSSVPTGTSSGTAISLGAVSTATPGVGAQDLTVATNASGGFAVYVKGTQPTGPRVLAAVSGTHAAPAAFGGGEGFGYTTNDTDIAGFTGPLWSALTTTGVDSVMVKAAGAPSASETNCVAYQMGVTSTTPAGTYATTLTYTAVPTF